MYCPAEVGGIDRLERAVALSIGGTGGERGFDARLVVAADGVHSAVRGAFGVAAQARDYGQTAIITTVLPQRFHEHVAYERFTGSGPLALLPLEGGRCTLVLTLSRAAAEAAMAWTDGEFLAEVQRRFGFRLGRFLKVGRRGAVPAVADARGAHQCRALRHHRQRGAEPASGRRHGLQFGAARCRKPRRAHRRAPP